VVVDYDTAAAAGGNDDKDEGGVGGSCVAQLSHAKSTSRNY